MKSRIVLAREYAELNQKELAEMLGISPSTLNGYERGNHDPKSDGLIKIAKACNVTTDFLLGLSDTMNKEADIQSKAEIDKISFGADKRLQKITHCYNKMDEIGKESLADQAEYLMGKHPKAKEEVKNHKTLKEDFTYVNAAHAENYDNAPDELKNQEESIMDDDDF